MFFFRKKMGGGVVDKVNIKVRFTTYYENSSGSTIGNYIEGNSVIFKSSDRRLNEDKNKLKQISLYQIFTGTEYNFKTTDILKKKNNDGSITTYLRFKLMSGLYGYISRNDLSDTTRTEYKIYLSTEYSNLQPNVQLVGGNFSVDEKYIPVAGLDTENGLGAFCYIGIGKHNGLDGNNLIKSIENLNIIDSDSENVLQLKLYTKHYKSSTY